LYSPVYTEDIRWNYEKFLIGPDGRPIYRYAQTVDPSSDVQLLADIKLELAKLKSSASSSGSGASGSVVVG
jgi:glutathione peroxidase